MTKPDELEEGAVAMFFFLHLETATRGEPHQFLPDHWYFQVEGKARPMLIWDVGPSNSAGRRWLRVLRFTSKGLDSKDRVKDNLVPLASFLSERVELSYLDVDTELKLPDSLLFRDERTPIVRKLSPIEYGNVMRIATHRAMSRRAKAERKS
jgi:hypothetical protein